MSSNQINSMTLWYYHCTFAAFPIIIVKQTLCKCFPMFAQKSHQLTLLRAGGHYIFSASKGIIGTRNFAAKVCTIRGHPKLTEKNRDWWSLWAIQNAQKTCKNNRDISQKWMILCRWYWLISFLFLLQADLLRFHVRSRGFSSFSYSNHPAVGVVILLLDIWYGFPKHMDDKIRPYNQSGWVN